MDIIGKHITPLPLRGTVGRCSLSLRNEESKGLEERLLLSFSLFFSCIFQSNCVTCAT